MNSILKGSWIQKVLGGLVLLASICQIGISMLDSDPATKPNYEALLTALAGVGIMTARQNNRTSEDVGAITKPVAAPK